MDDQTFRDRFRGSPVKRTKRRGLVRNAALALGNIGGPDHRPLLERVAAEEPDQVVSEAAEWALTRLRSSGPSVVGDSGDTWR